MPTDVNEYAPVVGASLTLLQHHTPTFHVPITRRQAARVATYPPSLISAIATSGGVPTLSLLTPIHCTRGWNHLGIWNARTPHNATFHVLLRHYTRTKNGAFRGRNAPHTHHTSINNNNAQWFSIR